MDSFVVSARKYRPLTFKQVVGQKAITSTLQNAIKSNHLAQAFLFTGPRGVGKTTCARIMAKTINCENLGADNEPCNQCESCTSFNKNASFNIHELDAASNNSVEDIRTLVEQVRIPPQVGKYKVYIIDEVHMLSQAAFNAFLKTLEEPPAYAKFILATTEKHKILPTILSRCQIFDFRRINVEDMADHLRYVSESEGVDSEDEALNIIAQKADGALRDALSTFDQIVSYSGNKLTYKSVIENLNILDYEYFFRVTKSILESDIPQLLLVFDEILENGFDGQHFIVGLAEHLRNLLVLKDVSTIDLMLASSRLKEQYTLQAAQSSPTMLIKGLDICNKYDLSYKTSNNKRLHIEIALMQLGQLENEAGKFSQPTIEQLKTKENSSEQKVEYATPKTQIKEKPVEKPLESTTVKEDSKEAKVAVPKEETILKEEDKIDKVADKVDDVVEKESPELVEEVKANSAEEKIGEKVESLVKDLDHSKPKAKVAGKKDDKGRVIKRISITDSLKALKKKKEESDDDDIPVIATEFDQERLDEVWSQFVVSYQSKSPSYSSAIGKYKPSLNENFEIEYKVDNKIMANDLLHQTSLLEFLKKHLNNNQVKLKAVLPDVVEKKTAYFDKEKFDELAKDYPGIVKLKDQLNLDFGV